MAASVIGELSVEISVDAQGVKDGIKASGKALKLGSKQLRESANKWGKWAVAATAAAAGVAAAVLKSNLDTIKEIKNTAAAADTQVAAFQRGAFAARSVGIDTEKYGDILKDVNDRVGDFLVSGAGPMVDFFETVAPKVGITADAFKGLSGQESLGLYIKTLEEAGVSQQEMTFFMEALAGDSIRLAPLFQNNAKSFKALTKEAKSLGVGLSDIDVAKAELASAALSEASGVVEALTQQATAELAPIIAAVTDLFVDMAKEAGGASEFIQSGLDGVISVIGVFADGLHGINIIFKGLELAAVGFSALVANVFAGIINIQAGVVDSFTGAINKLIEVSNSFLGTDFGTIPAMSDSEFVKSINETADNMIGLVSETAAELKALALEPLPSEGIKSFVDEAIVEYTRLAEAKAAALGDDKLEGEGVGVKKTSEVELFKAETIGLLEAMGIRFQSQEEMQLSNIEREKQMLANQLANGELTAIEHSEKLAEIKQNEEDVKRSITLQGIQAGLSALAANSKKVQKAMKAAAIVQAIIKGKQAAVDAWQAGMSTGGPWAPILAASYAAASIARTGSMISAIKSGGNSTGGGGGGGGRRSTPGGGQSQQQQQQAPTPVSRNFNINFAGQGLLSTDQVRELMSQINEQAGDNVNFTTSIGV